MDLIPVDKARVNRSRSFPPPKINHAIVKAVAGAGKIDALFDSRVIRLALLVPVR